tara:strand:+ start:11098 stop:12801 length:1704 start_codon:yes stop_codon:yes gene_type:complete
MGVKTLYSNHEKFKYDHIYFLLINYFKFKEEMYGNHIKDVINILMESEKKGETIIDLTSESLLVTPIEAGWPLEHINALEKSLLINNKDAPFLIKNKKLSFIKWSKKIDNILEKLFAKSINQINKNKRIKLVSENKIDELRNLFEISDVAFLQGGPGTGKTTLIIKLILNFLKSDNTLNIGLSAPTGKASARLKESLEQQINSSQDIKLEKIECQTLHRWIYNSQKSNSDLKYKLKELDFFIIDEMSMVSINLIELILELLANDCKLLLVGDANQLPPINSCSIFNYIFKNIKHNKFQHNIVNLKRIYRNSGEISELSKLIFQDKKLLDHKINQLIKKKNKTNLNIIECENKNIPLSLINEITSHLNELKKLVSNLSKKDYIFNEKIDNLMKYENETITNIFNQLNSYFVLCEKNTGIWSIQEINKIILKQNDLSNLLELDEGIPIMCTENNHELGISNGDIGVLIGNNISKKFLFRKFNKNNQTVVALIEPSMLENIIPAIAITIHKSQGSEAKKVSILWNQKIDTLENTKNKQLNNFSIQNNYQQRLLYTAITRSREILDLYFLN